MPLTVRDRGTLRWAALLLVVDAGVWSLAAMYGQVHVALGLFFGYGALSLLATAALYVDAARGGRPGQVLAGHRLPWLAPLFFPFKAVSWVTWLSARALRRGDGPDEFAPGLWVGPRPLPRELHALAERGVSAVLDLTSELPTLAALRDAPWTARKVPVLDRTCPHDDDLDAAVAWIVAQRAEGRGVYIHCAFGRGRSGALACAALLGTGATRDADAALREVRARRRWIRLREDQLECVRRFARRLDAASGLPPAAPPTV